MIPMRASSHWKFSSRKFPYLKKPSMLRFMHTLATSQTRFDRGVAAFPIRAPSQKFMFRHHTSLRAGGRKLSHDLVHSVLNRSGILFRTRANDSLANAAENELVGSAIDEIQDQCPLGVLHYVSGHSYSVPVCVRAV